MSAYTINIIGLILDIIGVILIFFFAIPSQGIKKDKNDPGRSVISTNPNWYKYLKWLGLGLVILGFSFQARSSYIFMNLNN